MALNGNRILWTRNSKECDQADMDSDAEGCNVIMPGSELTHSEALQMLTQLRNFANEKESDMSAEIQEITNITEIQIVRARCMKK